MENGKILDTAITASSVYGKDYLAAHGRLNLNSAGCAWASAILGINTAWIQVDLEDIKSVTGVATQGRCNANQWVTSYTVSYSTDGQSWDFFKESDSTKVRPVLKLLLF